MRILVIGASGSGTTTLGRALGRALGSAVFDADDYYWLAGDPPFQHKRDRDERLGRLLHDLARVPDAVVSGSVVAWGKELEDSFGLIVFLTVPAELRVVRLRARELELYGRVEQAFIDWAAQYDDGVMTGRSRAKHEQWLAERAAPVLRIDGDVSVDDRVQRVQAWLARSDRTE
jgi:adenylate kinase family enzyme